GKNLYHVHVRNHSPTPAKPKKANRCAQLVNEILTERYAPAHPSFSHMLIMLDQPIDMSVLRRSNFEAHTDLIARSARSSALHRKSKSKPRHCKIEGRLKLPCHV